MPDSERRLQDQLDHLLDRITGLFPGGLLEVSLEYELQDERVRLQAKGVGEPATIVSPDSAAEPEAASPAAPGPFRPSWSIRGHEVLAWIAEDVIDDDHSPISEALAEIYEEDPEQDLRGSDLLQYAGWPDRIKGRRPETRPWHYITLFYNGDPTSPLPTANDFPPGPSVFSALESQVQVLRDGSDPRQRADALAFVAHLVGDIHQPLHTLSLKNDEFPSGDRGGNRFKLRRGRNMHSLWDGLATSNRARAATTAAKLKQDFPRADFTAELQVTDPADWILESHRIGREAYDRILQEDEDQRASQAYRQWGRRVARRQTALGGYRLAKLLVDALS